MTLALGTVSTMVARFTSLVPPHFHYTFTPTRFKIQVWPGIGNGVEREGEDGSIPRLFCVGSSPEHGNETM